MRLLVTDLTEMNSDTCCVAGWDAHGGRMIRPLLGGHHWPQSVIAAKRVAPGELLTMTVLNQVHASDYPHHTEDTLIDESSIKNISGGKPQWFGGSAPPASHTVQSAFGGAIQHNSVWDGVRQGVYVASGSKVASLAAVEIDRDAIVFIEDFAKLKARVSDGQHTYKLSVSSLLLKHAFQNGGLVAVERTVPSTPRLHVRLGLARSFEDQPDKCYLMVNGVLG